jgi:SAM-dependent methyltransferase
MNQRPDHEQALAHNLASWQQRTPVHLRSELYRPNIEALRSGGWHLDPPTDTEVGDVAGLRVLHLQCHIGLDTLSLARRGACVTGLDFSPAAIDAARAFAREFDIDARFLVADAQQADQALAGEQFDLVFASFGVFCWIPDLRRWIDSACRLIRPGGALYIADGHPFLDVFDDAPDQPHGIDIAYSYFQKEPLVFGPGPTYADDGTGQTMPQTVEYVHPIGEFVTAVAEAGLRIEYLHEFPRAFFQRCEVMVEGPPGIWDFPPPLKGKLPMVFSLRASAPKS